MNLENVDRQELIFKLGYNMGIIISYRSLLKESLKILAHLQVSNSDIVELNEKILTALSEEDLKLTQSLEIAEDYKELITKMVESLDKE